MSDPATPILHVKLGGTFVLRACLDEDRLAFVVADEAGHEAATSELAAVALLLMTQLKPRGT